MPAPIKKALAIDIISSIVARVSTADINIIITRTIDRDSIDTDRKTPNNTVHPAAESGMYWKYFIDNSNHISSDRILGIALT